MQCSAVVWKDRHVKYYYRMYLRIRRAYLINARLIIVYHLTYFRSLHSPSVMTAHITDRLSEADVKWSTKQCASKFPR